MNKNDLAVEKLLEQYESYLKIHEELQKISKEKLAEASRLAKSEDCSLSEILLNKNNYEGLKLIDEKETRLKNELQEISDSMLFQNPIIWIMYKYKAYKNTSKAITTWLDFKKHCSPEGYICTKRFKFLRLYLKENKNIDINEENIISNDLHLDKLCEKEIIKDLLDDKEFLKKWDHYESHKKGNRVSKWENYSN